MSCCASAVNGIGRFTVFHYCLRTEISQVHQPLGENAFPRTGTDITSERNTLNLYKKQFSL